MVSRQVEVGIPIDWDHLSQPEFDRIVEALLDRLYSAPDVEIRAYDGRGGDGGRDVTVQHGSQLRIFQLKYFRDGFAAERKTRRKQITSSFNAAMAHSPAEWILVIPTNPTPGEEKFVHSLGAKQPGLKVTIMPRHQLDSRLARFPDLVDYFTRNALEHQAAVFQQEKALLLGGLADLTERAHALARVADTLDPNWAVDTFTSGDLVLHSFRPKTFQAAQLAPIKISFQGAFSTEHGDLRHVLKRIVEFGTDESVVLPPEVARRVVFHEPSQLALPPGDYEIEVGPPAPSEYVGSEAVVHVLDDEGFRRSSYQARVLHLGGGTNGYSLDLEFQRDNTLRLLVDGRHIHLKGDFNFNRLMPSAALQMMTMYRSLIELADCDIEVAGQELKLRRPAKPVLDHQQIQGREDLELLAEDLEIVQRHCRAYFPIPETVTAAERIDLRIARLLVEGHCVVYRGARNVSATLNGKYDTALKEMLSKDEVTLSSESTAELKIATHRLLLGPVTFFHTRVQVEGAERVLAALEAGQGEGEKLRMAPVDGEHFGAFMPSKRLGRDQEPLVATPWGLPGLDGPTPA